MYKTILSAVPIALSKYILFKFEILLVLTNDGALKLKPLLTLNDPVIVVFPVILVDVGVIVIFVIGAVVEFAVVNVKPPIPP